MQSVSDREEGEVRTPAGVRWLALLAGLLIAGLGAKSVLLDYSLINKLTHLDEFYRPLPAKFLKVDVRRDTSGNRNDWYPDVLFEYFVDGKSIWGWRLSYEEEPKPRAYWEERLARYTVGANVPVFYFAAEPKESKKEEPKEA